MPIYEYYCPTCQKEFDLMRPMSDGEKPASCPTCRGEGQKLVSVFASKMDYTIKTPAKDAFRQPASAVAGNPGLGPQQKSA